MNDRRVTTEDTTQNDGTFVTDKRPSSQSDDATFNSTERFVDSVDTEKQSHHTGTTLVHNEDLAFMVSEARGSLEVMRALKSDPETWSEIQRIGLEEEYEADTARFEYIVATYGEN